jgi:hypothetical protein
VLLWLVALAAAPQAFAQQPGATAGATQADLVGSWRLLSIEVEDSGGTRPDPFYGSGASGLLIYDSSGWVSVQIASAPRPRLDAPASRQRAAGKPDAVQRRAQLLDTYYAYYGTWTYDPPTATVTHRVRVSLYTGEQGASYSQQVEIHGRRMVFTRTRETTAGKSVQRKVWERIGP